MKDQKYLDKLRHSAAHLLAAAVLELYPKALPTIGPSIENGFYYDFDNLDIGENDLSKIEKTMHALVKDWNEMKMKKVTKDAVLKQFSRNKYKQELIAEFAKEKKQLSVCISGSFTDLCRGGHIENPTKELKNFKLLSVAGAYWRGDEKNKMLTRIYGTAWSSQKELENYINQLEEAKKRDHRRLGKELELFTINNDVGQGLTLWLPKGSVIRREIENYMVEEQTKMGYEHVYSPHIGQKSLWEKSGHWGLYRDKMYSPMDVDGVEYLVKPMTCPMHIQSYELKPRSYRELPLKIAEIASVYRYEQSGELSGLLRVRAFTQDDAHIFCTPEQSVEQFAEVFHFIQKLYGVFGFKDYRVRLGVRSKKEKYLGDDKHWKMAEQRALAALKKAGSDYFISEGDAAFYGPKADFLIRDALGREWQCGTVQVDFMLPERFRLRYIDKDGKEKTPVMIHRAPLGSLERFMAILIENYAGAFPVWLSPVQVKVLPITERNLKYAQKIEKELQDVNIRVEVDDRSETLQAKVRDTQMEKVPYMLIVGDREEKANKVALRLRSEKDLGQMELTKFVDLVKSKIETKALDLV